MFAIKVGKYSVGILNSDFLFCPLWLHLTFSSLFLMENGHTFFIFKYFEQVRRQFLVVFFELLIFRISVLTVSLSVFTSICVQRLSDFLSYFYENIFHSYLRC